MKTRRKLTCIAVALIAAIVSLAKVSAQEKNAESQPVGPYKDFKGDTRASSVHSRDLQKVVEMSRCSTIPVSVTSSCCNQPEMGTRCAPVVGRINRTG
jgi:hypothetical protein